MTKKTWYKVFQVGRDGELQSAVVSLRRGGLRYCPKERRFAPKSTSLFVFGSITQARSWANDMKAAFRNEILPPRTFEIWEVEPAGEIRKLERVYPVSIWGKNRLTSVFRHFWNNISTGLGRLSPGGTYGVGTLTPKRLVEKIR